MILAFGFGGPMDIAIIVGIAILLFGADKLPKLARSAGQAKKEFLVGQAEADLAAERAREEARQRSERANRDPMTNVAQPTGAGGDVIPPSAAEGSSITPGTPQL